MKWILSISNERSKFKVDASNDVYEINVSMYFKILNNIKPYTPLDISTPNFDHKIDNINFI
jgi:hypothetical protein